jgi:two-component system, OmpR family, response regulator MprA
VDLGLPDMDGVDLIAKMRTTLSAPVLVLSARIQEEQKIAALDAGADDYLVKPFATEELLARVRALLRRGKTPEELLAFGDLTLDPATRSGQRGEIALTLSEREADLLALLLRNARRVVPREQAVAEIWQGDASANVVDRYVSNLRRKLGEPPLIETVRGVGFIIR